MLLHSAGCMCNACKGLLLSHKILTYVHVCLVTIGGDNGLVLLSWKKNRGKNVLRPPQKSPVYGHRSALKSAG